MLKNYIFAALGVCGAAISNLFGGWSSALTTLVIFMMTDYITGVAVAGVFHNSKKTDEGGLKSDVGWRGLCRKGVMLLIVLIGCRLDILVGTNYIRDALIIAFCANELLSIVENAGLMGVPMPDVVIRAIEVLKTRSTDI